MFMKKNAGQGLREEWNGKSLPHAGRWKYIVEWWEHDRLDMDGNQHLLFINDEGETDVLVHRGNVAGLNEWLAAEAPQEISVALEFHVSFHSRILYPPEWAGEAYFEPRSAGTWKERLWTWLGAVTMAKRKDLP